MASGRFVTPKKALVAGAAVVALGLAFGLGNGVAAANQPTAQRAANQPAAAGARTCGSATTYAFSSITVVARACLVAGAGSPLSIGWSGDVAINTTGSAKVGYCRVDLQGSMHSTAPGELRSLSCFDLVNKGVRTYHGGYENRATNEGWSQVSVIVGTNTGTLRVVTASHEGLL